MDFYTFDNFADVVDISLYSNRLTRLDIKILNATVSVDLSKNPWFCDPKKPWQPPCKLVNEGDIMGVCNCGKFEITSTDFLKLPVYTVERWSLRLSFLQGPAR